MPFDNTTIRKLLSKDLTDVLIRIGLIAILVFFCVRVFAPFSGLMLWALILAVALYPLHLRLAGFLRGRQASAATILVVVGLLLIGTPMLILGGSFANRAEDTYSALQKDHITIKRPDPSVADWPIIGKRVYDKWNAAATDLPAYLKQYQPQIKKILSAALLAAADTAGSVLMFLASLIIAGIIMAYGEAGSNAIQRILSRIAGPARGVRLQKLSTATIRSVATGVIGVAFIQALLLGVGFAMAGIPVAGVLSFLVLILGIVQLPALVVSLPVIGYMWWAGDASTTANITWTIYLLLAGMADNVLKPLLLGRGVDAPMPVIIIGALGGMVTGGIIGLFLGAVLLAVGYQLFMDWVDNAEEVEAVQSGQPEPIDRHESALASRRDGHQDP